MSDANHSPIVLWNDEEVACDTVSPMRTMIFFGKTSLPSKKCEAKNASGKVKVFELKSGEDDKNHSRQSPVTKAWCGKHTFSSKIGPR